MKRHEILARWVKPGIGVKRWLLLLTVGNILLALGLACIALQIGLPGSANLPLVAGLSLLAGALVSAASLLMLYRNILAPYRKQQNGQFLDMVYEHNKRQRGMKVVAIGGGTGLPSVLRALKPYTGNITAIVTVADDGGSSGRLRRELGVLPPGDLRNNIAALADDENLMTQLFFSIVLIKVISADMPLVTCSSARWPP